MVEKVFGGGTQKWRSHSQVELLLPHWIKVAVNGLGPLPGLAHLDGDIRVTGSSLVFCLKPLRTNHWCGCMRRWERA